MAAAGSGVGLGEGTGGGGGAGAGQRPHGSCHSGPASGRSRAASRGRQRTGNAAGWAGRLPAPPGPAGTPAPDPEGPSPAAGANGGQRGRRAAGTLCPAAALPPGPLGRLPPTGSPVWSLAPGPSELIQGPDGIKEGSPHQGHVSHLTVMVPGRGFSSHFDGTGPESVTLWEPLPHPRGGLFGPQAPHLLSPTTWFSSLGLLPLSLDSPPLPPFLLAHLSQAQTLSHPHTHPRTPKDTPPPKPPRWAMDPQTLPPRPGHQHLVRPYFSPEFLGWWGG